MAGLEDVQPTSKSDLIATLQKQGYTDEQIENTLAVLDSQGVDKVSATVGESVNLWDSDATKAGKPPKPDFFVDKSDIKPFTPIFMLESNEKFTLGGFEIKAKKLNLNETMRLVAKGPHWMNYLGYGVPENLVDEYSGKYKIMETILTILERALGDYDFQKNTPTDFSYSVIEEVAYLFGVSVEHVLSSDPDEVLNGVRKLVEINQSFFMRLWNNSGPIKETLSLIGGVISVYTNPIKDELKKLDKLRESNES